MSREEQKLEGKNIVLSLLDKKEYISTKSLKNKGIAAGYWKNWTTYKLYLDMLLKEKKVESVQVNGMYLWRKK